MSVFIDIVTDALSDIGQLGIGQSMSPEQAAQAMRYANRRLANWSAKKLFLYFINLRQYGLTPGTQDYSIGPTGTLGVNQTRPNFLESAQVSLPGSQMFEPLNLLDRPKWGAIRDKGATCSANGLPQDIFPEYQSPNILVHLWTIPSNACNLYMSCWEKLQQFGTIYDNLNLPDEYELALKCALAIDLAPAYDQPVTPDMQQTLADALNTVQAKNAQALGGALGGSQTLDSPNLATPPPTGQ